MLIDFEKTASLDVDPQNGFTEKCPLELPVIGGHTIVTECNNNALYASKRYLSKDAHPNNGYWTATEENPQYSTVEKSILNVDIRWNQHCVVGTPGFELIEGLPHPSEYNFIVYKGVEKDMHPYSPVYHDLKKKISTGLIEKAKCDKIDTFILGGLALEYCLGAAAYDLKAAGFDVIINLAATKPIFQVDAEEYIAKAKNAGIKFVNSTKEFEIND